MATRRTYCFPFKVTELYFSSLELTYCWVGLCFKSWGNIGSILHWSSFLEGLVSLNHLLFQKLYLKFMIFKRYYEMCREIFLIDKKTFSSTFCFKVKMVLRTVYWFHVLRVRYAQMCFQPNQPASANTSKVSDIRAFSQLPYLFTNLERYTKTTQHSQFQG